MKRLLNKKHVGTMVLALFLASPSQAREPVDAWMQSFRHEARTQGISEKTLDRAFENFEPLDDVIALDRKQPETTKTLSQYLETVVSSRRIAEGRALYRKHGELLGRISDHYGVPPAIIMALWGVETHYGGNTGATPVIDALATLAWDGRRRKLFEGELMQALKIVESGEIPPQRMEGSWAGAMGQPQFMPSSFMRYAVDYDGDGRRDIWDTLPDVFASIANYLAENGWDRHRGWNSESPNYNVLLRWNRSRYFATSVGMLADAIGREE